MLFHFYDIESLENVFTLANYRSNDEAIEIYYLVDDMKLLPEVTPPGVVPEQFLKDATERILAKNKNFHGTVELYDLRDEAANRRLVSTFGLTDAQYASNPNKKSSYPADWRLVCTTDKEYDENKHPYFLGYNSFHYDTTEYVLYAYEVFGDKGVFKPTTAAKMRQYNDELFTPQFKDHMEERLRYTYKNSLAPSQGYSQCNYTAPRAVIRKNMLLTGRHLDVARLNEKQTKVGLKRILGMLGYQILESDKLRPGQNKLESYDQLLDLIAYNCSDVVNLRKLFEHKVYQSSFILKKQLLITYPELVYQQQKDKYAPDVSPYSVRNDRLTIDSSSAQFSTKSLCPYGHLKDYDVVSFMYPSEAKAKALGIPRVNVLEEAKKFFYEKFPQPEVRAKLDQIYDYYKSIEGKNFNESENYLEDHGIDPDTFNAQDLLPDELKPYNLSKIPMPNTCMFYYKADGTPSTCFVNFSSGGIHGAEYNERLYQYDLQQYEKEMEEWQKKVDLFDKVKEIYPDPCDLKRNKGVTIDDVKYKPSDFLKPKATVEVAYYKDYPKAPSKPEIFEQSTGDKANYKLKGRYAYTSCARTNHEDFTSYYPNMLRMMDAFFNDGLGYDRYGEIFDNKTKYGKYMKDKSRPAEERELYSVMRNGTKLILNSASGAGDASFESNIRMNNKIISMRIIGQLFTWRIGQAQTIEGASIISTNTDGLYSVLEATRNNEVLAREAEDIHVEIEPEPIYLISKDSNNRAEYEIHENEDGTQDIGEVASASGGTLSHRGGPDIQKSLAHPAIIDWALTEYLAVASVGYKGASLENEFVDEIGRNIIASARSQFNVDAHTLVMFQNLIASSPGTNRYVFAITDEEPTTPIPLQHYNRCFIVQDKTPDSVHLKIASAKAITDAQRTKRARENERPQQHDPIASTVLTVNGVDIGTLPIDKEAAISSVTGVENSWYLLINNNDIHEMSKEEIENILDTLDYDKYLTLMRDSFNNNWLNVTPELLEARAARAAEEKRKAKEAGQLFGDDEIAASADANAAATTNNEPAVPAVDMSDINNLIPKMVELKKTSLSPSDIRNGEFILETNGVLSAKSHTVLAEIFKTMTDTDIDTTFDQSLGVNDDDPFVQISNAIIVENDYEKAKELCKKYGEDFDEFCKSLDEEMRLAVADDEDEAHFEEMLAESEAEELIAQDTQSDDKEDS